MTLLATGPTYAATFVVTKTADTNDGTCSVADCSLREAVVAANAAGGADIITLPAGTYSLTSGFGTLPVTSNITINGAGSGTTTINHVSGTFRLFSVSSSNNGNLTLNGVTLTNGGGNGGAITITNNNTVVTVNNSVLSGNTVTGNGGAIAVVPGAAATATVTINSSTISGNTASGLGGGIYNAGNLSTANTSIISSTISGNTAAGGGGIYNHATNAGTATLNVFRSAITGNNTSGTNDGGGIYNNGSGLGTNANLNIANSTIATNTATRNGGGIYNTNSTGFLNNGNSNVNLSNVTITLNSAGAAATAGGGVFRNQGNLRLRNSIVSGNSGTGAPDCAGTMTISGSTVIGNTTGCTAVGSIAGPANLGPALNNPTTYYPLLAGSTARNAVTPANCTYLANNGANPIVAMTGAVTIDQRGITRPQETNCDAGAVEMAPPVAVDDCTPGYSLYENNILVVPDVSGVQANDTDADAAIMGDFLNTTLVSSSPPSGITYFDEFGLDGSFVFNPGDANGFFTITYSLTDNYGGSDTGDFCITVIEVNDPPVAGDDSATVAEDSGSTIINVLGNDSKGPANESGQTLTVTIVSDPPNGSTVNNGTNVSYTPDPNYFGLDSFTYTVCDNGTTDGDPDPQCDTATVTVTVTAVNDAPVAVNDSDTTNEDNAVTTNVLANDTDVENDPLSVTNLTQPANGTTVNNGDGTVTYTPNANFCGIDSYTYTANDGTVNSNVATVTITVTCVNDAPVAVNDADTTNEDNAVTTNVLANDTDVENDPLSVTNLTQPANGTTVNNGDGTVTYTPDLDFCGIDTYTYTANDGTVDSNVATVTITVTCVNDAPVAVNDSDTTAEDTPVTIDVLANDTDVENDTLTVVSVTQPANGTAVINGDGTITYTPDDNFCATDTFTYTITDGDLGDTATVTVTVTCVNDAPVAVDDADTTPEDTPVTTNVLANDTDIDNDPLSVTNLTQPANGTTVNNGDGTVTYTPDQDFCGIDTYTYTANDGATDSNVATVTITVTCVNDAPDAVDDSDTTTEDTPVTIDVLANDTDVDGDTLTITSNTQGANGSVTCTATDCTYTPNENFCATDTFTYTITDGELGDTATVTVTIVCGNDAPVANDDSYSVNEDTTLTVPAPGVLVNDSDVDNTLAELSVTVVDDVDNGTLTLNSDGSFTYTPDANFCGEDTFIYEVSDGTLTDTATVTITVNCVNDAPVAVEDCNPGYSVNEGSVLNVGAPGVLGNDSDVEGDSMSAVLVSTTSNGTLTLNSDGSFSYTPNADFSGSDSFTYKVSAGQQESETVQVCITVNNVQPSVTLTKTASPTSLPYPGGTFTFTLTITNNTSEPVTITSLTDSYPLSAQCTALVNTVIPGNGTVSCTYTVNKTGAGSYTNTATVTVRDNEQSTATSSDSETVVVQSPTTPVECGPNFVLTGQIINGTPGNDLIYGNGGADEIYGLGGDDCIFGGQGLDNLYGGPGNDVIYGNQGDDYIEGGAGSDLIHGNEDDDLILGGDDNDQLYGDAGSDCIFGQNGDDYINGGDGDDAPLVGGAGNDTIYGGAGHDDIYGDGYTGSSGHAEFPADSGAPGNDNLYGEAGDDEIMGGGGNDNLVAGQGDDNMYGEAGDDLLTGNERSDYFDGGAGSNDTAADFSSSTDVACVNIEFGCNGDPDNDGLRNSVDNCPLVSNADQANTDGDGLGNACDTDDDNDTVLDGGDNCPLVSNVSQTNTDGDGSGDACDSDDDGDTVLDGADNCPLVSNVSQTNTDGDGSGDACDSDDDGDTVPDISDVCPGFDDTVDSDGDGTADGCDPYPNDTDNDGVDNGADVCAGFDDGVDTDSDGTPDGCDSTPNGLEVRVELSWSDTDNYDLVSFHVATNTYPAYGPDDNNACMGDNVGFEQVTYIAPTPLGQYQVDVYLTGSCDSIAAPWTATIYVNNVASPVVFNGTDSISFTFTLNADGTVSQP